MQSFISWIGGKKLLKRKIIEQFPEEFDRYIEVFGGAGWVLFDKEKHADLEIYNDINGDLVNLFRCVKYHPEALQKELDWIMNSREQFFDSVSASNSRGRTDIQRAAAFYCRIKLSFGTDLRSFGVRPKNVQEAVSCLQDVSKRLKRVVIENADFERLLKTYDKESALFYLDPPYFKAEKYYSETFQPQDHTRLRDRLSEIKGKFILSYNDCPQIRGLYSGYGITEVDRMDNLAAKTNPRRYQEVIIKNY